MGLDVSHNCWSGPYSAFNRWRDKLAEVAGYKFVHSNDGFPHDVVDLQWDSYQTKNYYGDWDTEPDDALIYLIVHSDCEGVIHPEHAGPLADRLTKLLPYLSDTHLNSYLALTRRFIRGLRLAAAAGQDVVFH